jgi:ABC-type antimicrobial peptide transport system permease subunit
VAALITLGIVFMVAGFGVINTMMMSVFERTREFGVLRAIGIRPGRLVAMVVIEGMLLAMLAGTFGLLIGGALDWYLITYGLDFSADMADGFEFSGVVFEPILHGSFRIEPVIATMASVVIVSMFASLLPAWRAARLNPVEALRED